MAHPRIRVLLIIVIFLLFYIVLFWGLQKWPRHGQQKPTGPATNQANKSNSETTPAHSKNSPLPVPETTPNASPPISSPSVVATSPSPNQPGQDSAQSALGFVGQLKLIIPVSGVRPEQLRDTFDEARSEGRVHDAIDIPAPAGTPVLAAADGEIIKLFQSERGGTTIYQLSTDKKLVFYYAHLQRYADDIYQGKLARQGEVIAFVGDTGNAGAGNYHLHFSIAIVADPKRYWDGVNINPYPLLHH